VGDRRWEGKLSRYVTSSPGQLSLASPPWVGAMSTSLDWEDNRKSGLWHCTGFCNAVIMVFLLETFSSIIVDYWQDMP